MKTEYKILLSAGLIANFGDNLIGPFYAVFVEKIGGSILDMGYTITAYSIATGILMIAIGKISDKINKELITVLGYLLFALGSLGYLMVSSPWQLFILQMVFALATACLAAPLNALYARFIEKKSAGFQWGLDNGGGYIVVGLAILAGTFIISQFGFRTLFITMFIIQSIAVLVQAKLYFLTK